MKVANKLASALLIASLVPAAGCDKKEEAADTAEKKEEIPNVQVGLPPSPNFDDARAPEKWEDGSLSIFGLRANIDENIKAGEAGTEIEMKGFVQEIYVPPECPPDDAFCDPGKQPHFWITDKADTKGKKRAMMVVNYRFKIQDYEEDMWKDAPQISVEVGKQYKFKGKFKRFSDTGFAHNMGLLEFVAYEGVIDEETGQTGWVYPPAAPWHPIAVAAQEAQNKELAEKAAAALEKKKGG
jgi:hypothetical protein